MKVTHIIIIFLLFLIFFLRSPTRYRHTYDDNYIYSPTNGRILHIKEIDEKTLRIVFYLDFFTNHTQYVPIKSKMISKKKFYGNNFKAYHLKGDKNSNIETVLYATNHDFEYRIVQRTGLVARRLVNYIKPHTVYNPGNKLGFIMFGSRVDIDIPKHVIKNILVKPDDNITGVTKIIELYPPLNK